MGFVTSQPKDTVNIINENEQINAKNLITNHKSIAHGDVLSGDDTNNFRAPVLLTTVEPSKELLNSVFDTVKSEVKNSLDSFITIKL
uniref:Iron-sulfur cluster assembly scaffold protein n=1 Tax=Strongyloides papillosus TaxID=174720 RepID=A0A0N5BGG0_STREA